MAAQRNRWLLGLRGLFGKFERARAQRRRLRKLALQRGRPAAGLWRPQLDLFARGFSGLPQQCRPSGVWLGRLGRRAPKPGVYVARLEGRGSSEPWVGCST